MGGFSDVRMDESGYTFATLDGVSASVVSTLEFWNERGETTRIIVLVSPLSFQNLHLRRRQV